MKRNIKISLLLVILFWFNNIAFSQIGSLEFYIENGSNEAVRLKNLIANPTVHYFMSNENEFLTGENGNLPEVAQLDLSNILELKMANTNLSEVQLLSINIDSLNNLVKINKEDISSLKELRFIIFSFNEVLCDFHEECYKETINEFILNETLSHNYIVLYTVNSAN